VRALLKFLHTLGAIGMMGSCACLLVLMNNTPQSRSLADYAEMRGAMAAIVTWIFFPALIATLASGLLAIAINRSFQNAGWVWAKLATGVLLFEAGMAYLVGPIQEEAKRSASALAGQLDPASITGSYGGERGTIWLVLVIATVNIVLAIWRPRLTRIPD
jgi:uncharacterized membrane protein